MRFQLQCLALYGGCLIATAGCIGSGNGAWNSASRQARPQDADAVLADVGARGGLTLPRSPFLTAQQASRMQMPQPAQEPTVSPPSAASRLVQPASHQAKAVTAAPLPSTATLNVEGRTYRLELIDERPDELIMEPIRLSSDAASHLQPATLSNVSPNRWLPAAQPSPSVPTPPTSVPITPIGRQAPSIQPAPVAQPASVNTRPLNLPTALSMIGGTHPAVGLAQWRVQEAYARLDRAKVLWLPSLTTGVSLNRHDGNLQASDGSIVDVNRNSLQYGLGVGAVGAGTSNPAGVAARFHLADAIFQPAIAQKTAWARGHGAKGVINEELLNVSLAYLNLLDTTQDLRIVQETQQRTVELSKLTRDFAAAGQGLRADADRLETELRLVENRVAAGQEQVDVASARLAQALSIDASQAIVPLDSTVVPIDLVSLEHERASLIRTGLSTRPELKESQALVAAACEAYRREKLAPFVPSVLLGFSAGGFGGGLGNNLDSVDDRYDFDAIVSWELRNLGLGERAARRETQARVQQAKFEKIRVLDQVAREISEAHAQVVHRAGRITISQKAIRAAKNSYDRNVSRIRDGQGLPLEVLQSLQALEDSQRAYLRSVVDYNNAQFRLQWALGWPVFAPGENP